jgi:hypothetical protein
MRCTVFVKFLPAICSGRRKNAPPEAGDALLFDR